MTLPYLKSIVPPGDFAPLTRADLAGSIPDRFNEIATHNPQRTAVCDHVKSLTYLELQRLVSKAAAIIRRAMGPSASAKGVGLIFDPTVESVVGILGVLASGNFFCPISPRDPPARVRIYLEEAEIKLILTSREAFPDRLRSELQSEQVVFIDELAENDVEPVSPATLNPHQLAAILYTSASTGIPKGVTHTHKTLMQMVRIKGNALGISPSDKIAGLSTFTFGSYYWNVFATVLTGATLHLYDFYRFPFENLESWLIDRRITHFHCTPTTLRQFLAALDEPTVLADLRLVSLGGEAVYPNDVYQFQKKLSQATALCTTGATIETWFYGCTFFQTPFPDGVDQLPMGFIHPECSVEVCDDQGGKLPPGQTGEIAVRSECLSPGYWKRAELNAAKYVVGEDQKRYFRSGDLGTLTPDGLLYQKGRSDFQVKIRGMRVDLADIEAVLHTVTPESNKPWSSGEPGRTTTWNWSPILSQLAIAPLAGAKSTNSWRQSYRPTKFPRVSFFSSPFPSRTRTRWTERHFPIRAKSKQQETRNGSGHGTMSRPFCTEFGPRYWAARTSASLSRSWNSEVTRLGPCAFAVTLRRNWGVDPVGRPPHGGDHRIARRPGSAFRH